jgi:hypothetical protein
MDAVEVALGLLLVVLLAVAVGLPDVVLLAVALGVPDVVLLAVAVGDALPVDDGLADDGLAEVVGQGLLLAEELALGLGDDAAVSV